MQQVDVSYECGGAGYIEPSRSRDWFFQLPLIILLTLIYLFFFDSYGDNLSYDYPHYVDFISSISNEGFVGLLENISFNFPYYISETGVIFEFGFVSIAYIFSLLFRPDFAYGLLTSVFLFLKMEILRRSGVGVFGILIFFVFSVSLFETNAVRAGVAVFFVILSFYSLYARQCGWFAVFSLICAVSVHVSALLFLAAYAVAFFLSKSRQWKLFLVVFVACLFFLVVNLRWLFIFVGGKLGDYVEQADINGLYTGASGFNSVSLLCGILIIRLMLSLAYGTLFLNSIRPSDNRLLFFYMAVVLIISFILVLAGGVLSIVGDRLWHMAFCALLPLYSGRQIFVNSLGSYDLLVIPIFLLVVYYGIFSTVFLYPQSNFFSFFTAERVLESQLLY